MAKYAQIALNVPLKQSFSYEVTSFPDAEVGMRVEVPFGRTKKKGIILSINEEAPEGFELKPIDKLVDPEPLLTPELIRLGQWMSQFYFSSLGEVLNTMIPSGKREKSLPSLFEEEIGSPEKLKLSDEQENALQAILKQRDGWNYLYGITGSGKTEVFLQTAQKTLEEGRGVIFLVPEIALSQQMSRALKKRFSDTLAVIHSRLTPSQKLTEWKRILKGEARIVVGARSAVFAPVANLGLIIIDEEHEGSYKSSSSPRYHARQVAFYRSRKEQCRLILGSATPSVESWNLMERGRLQRLLLTKRLSGGAVPQMNIVDIRAQSSVISAPLLQAMTGALQEGRQVLLFLNRRGFSYTFHCKSCGIEASCKHCSVPLTFHKSKNALVCHYCGYREIPRSHCDACGSLDVGYVGFGTEHIEEEVRKLFPEYSLTRVDTDSVTKKGSLEEALEDFRSGKTKILLGTQMVAKGLNFPGVKVVGILLADTSLGLPDFRAGERTFSLLVQVAGRAGRYTPDGEVYIQTLRPDSLAIQLAADLKLESFYAEELKIRDILDFPPFSRLIRMVYRSKNQGKAQKAAQKGVEDLLFLESENTEVMGPAENAIFMVAGNYRYQVLIKTRELNQVHARLQDYFENVLPPSGVYREVDVDPVQLL